MWGLGLRGESAAHFLDGPRFFAARGLPEQLRRFLGTALGDERLVEGFFKACAALRLAGWIAGLSGPPFRGLVAGNTGFELCISLHIGRPLIACSSLCPWVATAQSIANSRRFLSGAHAYRGADEGGLLLLTFQR